MQNESKIFSLASFLLIAVAITAIRLWVLVNAAHVIDLYPDEAYYWGWARHLEWGYYSKPPMVAWLITLSTSLFGDSFAGIKMLSPIVYLLSGINIYLIARRLFDDDAAAFYSALAFITLPAVWLSSILISTDVVFLFFWSLAMLFFIRALQSDRWSDWIVAGIAGGMGLLSKYTMIIFVVSALLYLLTSRRYRHHLKNPRLYTAILLAALVYMPNLWWNATHDFVSFKHTSRDNAHIEGLHFHLGKMFEFLGSQFGVFGPILFGWLLTLLPRYRTLKNEEATLLLWWFIVPMFGLILTVSILSRAFANWSAPMYVASTILVAYYLWRHHKKWLYAALAFNIFMGVSLYFYPVFERVTHGAYTAKIHPLKRVKGWHELGKRVSHVLTRHPDATLMVDDRKLMAELIYYIHPHPFNAVKYNPEHKKADQYDLTAPKPRIGRNYVLITEEGDIGKFAPYFEKAQRLEIIEIPLYKGFSNRFYVYYLQKFKGY